jgi:hypothetical protein
VIVYVNTAYATALIIISFPVWDQGDFFYKSPTLSGFFYFWDQGDVDVINFFNICPSFRQDNTAFVILLPIIGQYVL